MRYNKFYSKFKKCYNFRIIFYVMIFLKIFSKNTLLKWKIHHWIPTHHVILAIHSTKKKKKKGIMKRENDVSSKTLSYFFLFNLYPSLSSIYLLKNIFFYKKKCISKNLFTRNIIK